MPFGQLLMSIAVVREAIGGPVRERMDFSDPLYSGDLFLSSFGWMANSSANSSIKGSSEVDLTKIQSSTEYYNSSGSSHPKTYNADSISIMWYLASFGALVVFFLLISFSEVCCKKSFAVKPEEEPEVSPPPYDLFAPPPYDSLCPQKKPNDFDLKKKGRCEVFVIHVFGDKSKSQVAPSENAPRNSAVNARR